jgi:hypothetical protein
MDHFQKEPPLNLKGTTGAPGGRKGPEPTILKEQIGNPAQTECPLWVIRGQIVPGQNPLLSAIVQKRTLIEGCRMSGPDATDCEMSGRAVKFLGGHYAYQQNWIRHSRGGSHW